MSRSLLLNEVIRTMTVYINWHILSGFTGNYQNYFSNKVILWFIWKPKAALGIHHTLVQKIYIFWALNWKCGSEMLGPNKEGTDLSFMDKRLLNPALKRARLEKQSSVKWRAHHKRFELYCCGIMRKKNFNDWFFTSYFKKKKKKLLVFFFCESKSLIESCLVRVLLRCSNGTQETAGAFWAYNYCPTSNSWIVLLGLILYLAFFAPGESLLSSLELKVAANDQTWCQVVFWSRYGSYAVDGELWDLSAVGSEHRERLLCGCQLDL